MRRAVTTKSKYSTDLDLVLNLPLYETGLKEKLFVSYDSYAHKCAVTGAIWGLQGRTFNGTSDKIVLVKGGAYTIIGAAVTLDTWVRLDKIHSNAAILGYNGVAGQGYELTCGSNNLLSFRVRTNVGLQSADSNATVSVGTIYHVIGVYDGANILLYLNSVLQTSQPAQTGNITDPNADMWLGGYYGDDNLMQGLIGEVRIYNRALTLQEIQNNYLATKWRFT